MPFYGDSPFCFHKKQREKYRRLLPIFFITDSAELLRQFAIARVHSVPTPICIQNYSNKNF